MNCRQRDLEKQRSWCMSYPACLRSIKANVVLEERKPWKKTPQAWGDRDGQAGASRLL